MSVHYLADRLAARTNSNTHSVARSRSVQIVPEGGCLLSSLRDNTYFKSRAARYPNMAGMVVFKSVADALRAGYQVYDRTDSGYLVRTRTEAGWAMAIVILAPNPRDAA